MARPAKKTKENKSGFSDSVLRKLEDAFLQGMNNRQACFLADISESVFYEVLEKTPELAERFKLLSENTKVLAKKNIHTSIKKGKGYVSMWYLERAAKDEFGERMEVTGADGKELMPFMKIVKETYDKDSQETPTTTSSDGSGES